MAEGYTKVQTFSGLFLFMFSFVAHGTLFYPYGAVLGTSFLLRSDQKIRIFWTHAGHLGFCLLLLGVKLRNKRLNKAGSV